MKLKGTKLRWFFKEALRDFLPPRSSPRASTASACPSASGALKHGRCASLPSTSIASLRGPRPVPRGLPARPAGEERGAPELLWQLRVGADDAGAVVPAPRPPRPGRRLTMRALRQAAKMALIRARHRKNEARRALLAQENETLPPSLWDAEVNAAGHLSLGGCDTVALAREFGTPLHVVHRARLEKSFTTFRDAFATRWPKVVLGTSYKTNPLPGVIRELHRLGSWAEVISHFELWLALQLGCPANASSTRPRQDPREPAAGRATRPGGDHLDNLSEIDLVNDPPAKPAASRPSASASSPPVGWSGSSATASSPARPWRRRSASMPPATGTGRAARAPGHSLKHCPPTCRPSRGPGFRRRAQGTLRHHHPLLDFGAASVCPRCAPWTPGTRPAGQRLPVRAPGSGRPSHPTTSAAPWWSCSPRYDTRGPTCPT